MKDREKTCKKCYKNFKTKTKIKNHKRKKIYQKNYTN